MLNFVRSTTGQTRTWNEIDFYQSKRMMGVYEAVFHILRQPFVVMSHSVVTLVIHLLGQEYVYYRGEPTDNLLLQENSMLLAFFQLMEDNPHLRHIFYVDVVKDFSYDVFRKRWRPKGSAAALGRLMHVNPSPRNMELFYLRLLLLNRPGPTSFLDLLTVDDNACGTFKDACEALGLSTTSGVNYEKAIEEVAEHGRPWQLRMFFAVLAAICHVSDVNGLWLKYRDVMASDLRRQRGVSATTAMLRARAHILSHFILLLDADQDRPDVRQTLLASIQQELTVPDSFGTESVPPLDDIALDGRDVGEGDDADAESGTEHPRSPFCRDMDSTVSAEEYMSWYTAEQRDVHKAVMDAVLGMPNRDCGNFFALEAFVYNGLMKDCHSRQIATVACAMTAIAAQLLIGGDTANRTFGIPVKAPVDGIERSYLQRDAAEAKALTEAGLIVVDEVSMMSLWQVRLIDHLLRVSFRA